MLWEGSSPLDCRYLSWVGYPMKKAPVGYQIWVPPHDGYQLAIFVRWVLNGGGDPF